MKTTRTTVFLSLLSFLAVCLFAASSFADVTYTNDDMPGETLVTGTGEGGVGSVTFNISGTDATSVSYGGVISGSGSITKTGAGELVLSGASSDYTGTVNINIGTLTLQNDETRFAGNISVNNEAIFKCGTRVPQISSLTVNNSGSFFIGATKDSYGVYLSEFTLNSGYVEFDINDSSTGAPEGLDYLYVNNGSFNNGVINISFNKNDESSWRDNAPSTGYLLIEAGQSLSFDKDSIRLYADGQETDNWYLEQQGKFIYLKRSTTTPPTPSTDPWYHVYSSHDMGLDSWLMNNSPKIGVEFNSGAETAEFGTADDPRTIAMYINGDFKYGEYQIGEGHTLTIGAKITGDADLRKTGAGTLILTADNDFTGDTYIEEGTLTLVVPNPATAHKGTLGGGTTVTVDGALNMNDSSRAKSILNGHADIFGNRASSGPDATSIGLIRLINGGILQNDSTGNHITVSSIVEMENGVIQIKETGAGSDAGNFLFDNAIHVLSGQNNQITARTISIRHHDYATYAEGEDAGYFYVEEGATLTMTSEIKSYGAQTIPFVKTGKGDLILNNYSDSEICRFTNLNGDFIVREGKVISNKKKDPQSTFGKGAVIVEKDGWLECHVSNQFGYNDTVQKDIYVYGTLKPSTNTHMHELNLIGGTVEEEYVTSASGDGLDFHNRAGKITSSGESIIKSKVTSGKSGNPGTMQIDVTDGNLTITGLIVGTSPFTKTGAGTLTLTNANTMSDSFTINNGVVVAGNEVALGIGAVTIGSSDNAVGQLTIGSKPAEALNLTVGGAVTVNGGQINFDFTDSAFDTLIATNGFTFTTGTFNLNFAQGTESTWFDNVPDEGYKIVSITGGTYTGDADLTSYLSGRTQAWSLTATSDGIYLGKAETDPYWNPIRDEGQDWPIDGTNKIGVKYTEDDVKTASHDESISLDSPEGVFIIGEDYEFEQVGPISGGGKVTKTGPGELFLTGENSYTGGTEIEEGSVVLVTDDEGDGTAGVGPIDIDEDGRLVYDVDEGYTKTIDNAITGNGTITKTGPGTLQATPTSDKPLQAADFDVDAGRLNLAGTYEGNLNVVGPLDDDGGETILSPGGSEGADKIGAATVYGDVTIDAGATGLFEFSKYNSNPLLRSFDTLAIEDGTFTLDGTITLAFLNNDAAAWAGEGETYKLVSDENFYSEIEDMSEFLANFANLFGLLGVNGDGLYLVGLGVPEPGSGVPEPSTWALLLLGTAGLYWMRRRK